MKQAAQKSYDLMAAIKRDKDKNPVTLEGAVRSVILKNPGMIQYRDSALGIMYCVLGAGIGWHKGRLGDRTPNNYMNMPPAVGGQGCWSRDFGLDESLKSIFDKDPKTFGEFKAKLERGRENEIDDILETIEKIDKRCQQYQPVLKNWYPISWYACNLCVPTDAQKDFRDGAIETIQLILKTEHPLGTKRWIEHQRTKTYAQEILDAILTVEGMKNKNE